MVLYSSLSSIKIADATSGAACGGMALKIDFFGFSRITTKKIDFWWNGSVPGRGVGRGVGRWGLYLGYIWNLLGHLGVGNLISIANEYKREWNFLSIVATPSPGVAKRNTLENMEKCFFKENIEKKKSY